MGRNVRPYVFPVWHPEGCDQIYPRIYGSASKCMTAIFDHEEQTGHLECCEPVMLGYRATCPACKQRITNPDAPTRDEAWAAAQLHETTTDHQQAVVPKLRRQQQRQQWRSLVDEALGPLDG
jgi:hypothetical protein